MKIISCGGGVDADGNYYAFPEVEREVPDDYFVKLCASLRDMPKGPNVMFVHHDILDALRDAE